MALVPSAREGRGRRPEPPSFLLLQNDLDSIGTEFKQSDFSFYVQLLRAGENHHTFYNYYEDDHGYYYSERRKRQDVPSSFEKLGEKVGSTSSKGYRRQKSTHIFRKIKGCISCYSWGQPIPSENWALIQAGKPTAVLGKATWKQLAFPIAHPMDQTALRLQLGSPAPSPCER